MSEALTYDDMGNIIALNRNSAGSSTYSYSGNQLTSIAGSSVSTATNYVYDTNGNATTDGRNNKTITYNLLNLPATVSGGLSYTYDATGTKLTKTVSGTSRQYIDGIEYNGSTIEFIHTKEGRAVNNSGTYSYEYMLRDHLGNTRATIKQDGSIVQVQDYYAFGREMNPGNSYSPSPDNAYKYNGKELQPAIEQFDYGARFYDPIIGRWHVTDPLSENHYNYTPYNYVLNNPLRYTDVFGLDTIPQNSNKPVRKGDEIEVSDGKYVTASSDDVPVKASRSNSLSAASDNTKLYKLNLLKPGKSQFVNQNVIDALDVGNTGVDIAQEFGKWKKLAPDYSGGVINAADLLNSKDETEAIQKLRDIALEEIMKKLIFKSNTITTVGELLYNDMTNTKRGASGMALYFYDEAMLRRSMGEKEREMASWKLYDKYVEKVKRIHNEDN